MPARYAYREIDFSGWKRIRHYELFSAREYPFIGVTTELDITEWDAARRRSGRKFFPAFLHSVMLAITELPEANHLQSLIAQGFEGDFKFHDSHTSYF